MARPDLDDGYLRYAHELDAALACADFTKGARIVLRVVFSQVFGPARAKTAKVFPSDLARASGFDKAHLCRAVRELTDSGVLDRVADCEYRFVKDYERWTKKGAPRLSPGEVAFARSAPLAAMSHKKSPGANPGTKYATNPHVNGANPGTMSVPIEAPAGANRGTDSVPESAPSGANRGTGATIEERARSEKAGEGFKNGLLAGKPIEVGFDPNLCEADRIGEQVEDWFPSAGWGVEAFEMCKTYSTASVEWGFRTAYAKALKGERITLKRVKGLVNFAEDNPMSPEVRGPVQAPQQQRRAPSRNVADRTEDQKAELRRKLQERRDRDATRCG